MEHPLLFEAGDPLVERVRRICLRYPEATEKLSWGRPHFLAGKNFAFVGARMDRPYTLVFKPDPESRRADDEDPRFFLPPYWGASGWRAIDIDGRPDWQEIAELIDESYRQIALKRQLAALEAHPLL
ncbi:MmcQ/YjbR family DNA-binding protein [Microbacteriaceae bacterium VKM Ac-2855]|nr:MmcQ/YjbR family DNA-binding protein [Microbacteriaceae bacterium VKM Ac-2855]